MQTIIETDMDEKKIAAAVLQLRKDKGWTQETLAHKAGVDTKLIYNIEHGIRTRRHTLDCVAGALGVDVDYLKGGSLKERVARSERDAADAKAKLKQVIDASSIIMALSGAVPAPADKGLLRHYTDKLRSSLQRQTATYVATQSASPLDESVALIGVGGQGKSWLMRRHALSLIGETSLVVVGQPKYFDGDLDRWLQESVAFAGVDAAPLLRAAMAETVVITLVADGLNECAHEHLPRLKEFLGALRARGVKLFVTARTKSDVPEELGLNVVAAPDWTLSDRLALAQALCPSTIPPALARVLEHLRSPMQVALACSGTHSLGDASSLTLLSRFMRNAFPEDTSACVSCLRALEGAMRAELRLSLDEARAIRVLEAHVERNGLRAGLVDTVLRATAVVAREAARVSFQHEEFGGALRAEAISEEPDDTAWDAAVADPRNRALLPLLLDGAMSDHRIRKAIAPLGVRDELGAPKRVRNDAVADARLGTHGARARRVVENDIAALIDEEHDRVRSCRIVERDRSTTERPRSQMDLSFTFDEPVDDYRGCLFAHLEQRARASDLLLLGQLADLIDHTVDVATAPVANLKLDPSFAIWRLLVITGDDVTGAGIVVRTTANTFGGERLDERQTLAIIRVLAPRGAGSLLWLCELLKRNGAQNAAVAEAAISSIERAAAQGSLFHIYAALELAPLLAVTDELRSRMLAIVEGVSAKYNDWQVNTAVIEALEMLGAAPSTPVDNVAREIAMALSNPTDTTHQQLAYGIYATQFEPFGAGHHEAIEALSHEDAVLLRTMAVMSSRAAEGTSFWTSLLLRQLIDDAPPDAPLLREALDVVGAPPPQDSLSYQEALENFCLAHSGRGHFGFPPFLGKGPLTPRDEAWLLVGNVLRELVAGGTPPPHTWTRLHDLLEYSVDVVSLVAVEPRRTQSSDQGSKSLVDAFGAEVRALLHAGLAKRTLLRPALKSFTPPALRAVHALALVGDNSSRELLVSLSDDAELAQAAVAAVAVLDGREEVHPD